MYWVSLWCFWVWWICINVGASIVDHGCCKAVNVICTLRKWRLTEAHINRTHAVNRDCWSLLDWCFGKGAMVTLLQCLYIIWLFSLWLTQEQLRTCQKAHEQQTCNLPRTRCYIASIWTLGRCQQRLHWNAIPKAPATSFLACVYFRGKHIILGTGIATKCNRSLTTML